ncbi:thioesterase II family protein [Endothiovibrio diazotrophicus]
MKFNAWVTCPSPKPDARLRMFCLPFAGGGASVYQPWGKRFGPDIEVCSIQLPGRENRASEPAFRDIQALAGLLANQLALYLDKPYLIYGHSMGGLLTFEVLRQLQDGGYPLPQVAFIAAHRAAHLPPRRRPLFGLDDRQFIQKVSDFGGFQQEILVNEELLNFVLPTLRADFEACDGYRYEPGAPVDCPLVAISGAHDLEVPPEDMDPWQEHTLHPLHHVTLDAGHFFLKTHADALIDQLQRYASQQLPE